MTLERVSENYMTPLSAFDARAWVWIRKGWELTEYIDRRRESKERGRQVAELERLWATADDKRELAIGNLKKDWARSPESRGRGWRGWWIG